MNKKIFMLAIGAILVATPALTFSIPPAPTGTAGTQAVNPAGTGTIDVNRARDANANMNKTREGEFKRQTEVKRDMEVKKDSTIPTPRTGVQTPGVPGPTGK